MVIYHIRKKSQTHNRVSDLAPSINIKILAKHIITANRSH